MGVTYYSLKGETAFCKKLHSTFKVEKQLHVNTPSKLQYRMKMLNLLKCLSLKGTHLSQGTILKGTMPI